MSTGKTNISSTQFAAKKLLGKAQTSNLKSDVNESVPSNVSIIATGRSDFPNQVNNSLAYPGFFRGLVESKAEKITNEMKVEAAKAISSVIKEDNLSEDFIMPSMFDRNVVKNVSEAVVGVASEQGLSRRKNTSKSGYISFKRFH